MRIEDENYEEKRTSPLWIALLSALITGGVFVASDLLNTVVDYGSTVEPEPIQVKSRLTEEERDFFSPERAKRRANYVLSQGNRKEKEGVSGEDDGEVYDGDGEEEFVTTQEEAESEEEFFEDSDLTGNNGRSEWQEGEAINGVSGITLQGVLMGDGKGIAVLEYQGKSHTLTEGESIGTYKIDKVYSDRVELSKGGQTFRIALQSTQSDNSQNAVRSDAHPVLPNPESVPLPSKPSSLAKINSGGTGNKNFSSEPPEPSRVDIRDFSDHNHDRAEYSTPEATPTPMYPTRKELAEYLEKGAAIIAEFKAQPDESGLGVKVQFLKSDNIMSRLGLKDGDVITRINNKSILSSEELYNSMLSVSEMPFVNIEYKRNGEIKTLVYDLQ
ncbi:hypothetical protein IJT10_00135 [bacterium]|nr:hypothetical protein [bacterium]